MPRPPSPPAPSLESADAGDFLRSLGRRERISTDDDSPSRLSPPPRESRASRLLIARRGVFWAMHLLRFGLRLVGRTLIGRNDLAWRATAFRQLLQTGGTVAQKLGQQLSIRTDTLDPVYCRELGKLLDRAPAMAPSEMLEILTRAYGRPVDEIFRILDPEPIGSASIACVYQAELHSGERVAVKIRRPNLIPPLDADLRILLGMARVGERLGLVPEGSSTSSVEELRRMLLDETDFTIEARYTELFRRNAKKFPCVSAPKLYAELSTSNVLVTEFVSGAFLSEFLTALDTGQQDRLDELVARGFDLQEIARSLIHAFFWGVFEADVFHADVHPANIIVQPDNSLIFIDFGSCGRFSSQFRQKLRRMIVAMNDGDADLAARATLSLSEPMPLIETSGVIDKLSALYTRYYLAVQSEHSHWTEKTSGGLFIETIKVVGMYGAQPGAELIRFCRANMLYDTMIYRLHSRIDPVEERRRYEKGMYKRQARRLFDQGAKRSDGLLPADIAAAADVVDQVERMGFTLRRFADVPRFTFLNAVSKAAYTVDVALRTGLYLGGLLAALAAVQMFSPWSPGSLGEAGGWERLTAVLAATATSLPFLVLAGLLLLVSLRKVMLVLKTTEVHNQL